MCLLSRCTFRYQRCTLDQNLTIFKCFVMRFVLFARAYFATFEDAETPRHGYSTPLCYSVGRRHVTIVIDLYCTWPIQPTNCVCEAPLFERILGLPRSIRSIAILDVDSPLYTTLGNRIHGTPSPSLYTNGACFYPVDVVTGGEYNTVPGSLPLVYSFCRADGPAHEYQPLPSQNVL